MKDQKTLYNILLFHNYIKNERENIVPQPEVKFMKYFPFLFHKKLY